MKTERNLILLAGIISLSAIPSFLFLGEKSFWGDEILSVLFARESWSSMCRTLSLREANMSLYYVLLKLWLRLGDSEFTVRTLSVLFALLSLPTYFFIAFRLFGRVAGQISCFLLAVNAFFVQYAQEARSYSLLLLLTGISSLCLLRALERPDRCRIAGYAISSALAVYSHFFALFVLAAHAVSLLLLKGEDIARRRILWCVLPIAALLSPLAAVVPAWGKRQIAWVPGPTPKSVFLLFEHFAGHSIPLLVLLSFAVIFAFRSGIRSRRDFPGSRAMWSHLFLALWLFLPILGALLVSLWKPVFVPRFLLVSLPPFLLAAGAGLAEIRRPLLRGSALALIAFFSIFALAGYYQARKADWRAATNLVLSEVRPGDSVLFYEASGRLFFDFYRGKTRLGENSLINAYPARYGMEDFLRGGEEGPTPEQLRSIGENSRRVWLVLYHDRIPGMGKDSRYIVEFLDGRFPGRTAKWFSGVRILLYRSGEEK